MDLLMHSDGSAELYHHGIKGMKWGVRRYQNKDGTLTESGKKRKAKIDAADERYRSKQMAKTENYYNNDRRSGPYGINIVEGINSLKRKLNSDSDKYDKDTIRAKIETQETLKKIETTKVSKLTHDDIQKERVAVGKAVVKDLLMSSAISAITVPTTGLVYGQYTSPQSARSKSRLNPKEKNNKNKSVSTNSKNVINKGDFKGVNKENYDYLEKMFKKQGTDISLYKPREVDEYGRVKSLTLK